MNYVEGIFRLIRQSVRIMQAGGRFCHASAHRAVRALRALVDYAEFRAGCD